MLFKQHFRHLKFLKIRDFLLFLYKILGEALVFASPSRRPSGASLLPPFVPFSSLPPHFFSFAKPPVKVVRKAYYRPTHKQTFRDPGEFLVLGATEALCLHHQMAFSVWLCGFALCYLLPLTTDRPGSERSRRGLNDTQCADRKHHAWLTDWWYSEKGNFSCFIFWALILKITRCLKYAAHLKYAFSAFSPWFEQSPSVWGFKWFQKKLYVHLNSLEKCSYNKGLWFPGSAMIFTSVSFSSFWFSEMSALLVYT